MRAELLGATAEDTGEGAWIVRAGGYPLRQGLIGPRIGHWGISQYQPQIVPGLLQTPEYAERSSSPRAGKTRMSPSLHAWSVKGRPQGRMVPATLRTASNQ